MNGKLAAAGAAMSIKRAVPVLAFVAGLAIGGRPIVAQTLDLTKLSLEALLDLEITTVSRREQTLLRTAAAVHVITAEDIRRSDARTIPDLLRMVPGFNVAQVDATTWAVSARGFNGIFANKLLVLIDGRSVYSPMFGGVYWDLQTLPLADIDRIEVVRGPGGALWGTNAVNGVVNIITKGADDTQGVSAKATIGQMERGAGEARYGGRLAPDTFLRVYGKSAALGSGLPVEGFAGADDARYSAGGGRLDWLGAVNQVTVHGSVLDGRSGHVRDYTLLTPPWGTLVNSSTNFSDGTLVASWRRSTSRNADTSVQASYQRYARLNDFARIDQFGDRYDVAEAEARRREAIGRHEVVGGVGYRYWSVHFTNGFDTAFEPADGTQSLTNGFVQDEITLSEALRVTPGLKVEHTKVTGLEFQPSARMTWAFDDRSAAWAAVSRSIRTPSSVDRGLRTPATASPGFGGVPVLVMISGSPDVGSEAVVAFEVGYRVQATRTFFDVTAFRSLYSDLVAPANGDPVLGGLMAPTDATVRLLLVDDDGRFGDYLRVLLQRAHVPFQIQQVENVRDALRELARGHHHVCLLDYLLGTENGLDVLRRAHERETRTPIILLTGEQDESLELTAIEERAADYLFEPFFTTKVQGKGTGLGLATVYGIVKQTGGEIVCDTAPGAGTTFSIFLPATSRTVPAATSPEVRSDGGTGTILLVEDRTDVRQLTRRILESRGYRVLDAGDATAAFRLAEETPIDLLLTDVVMPDMSGPDLAKRMREHLPAVRVIFMSGFMGHSALSDTRGAPLIQKPFTPDNLARKVREVLEQPGSTPRDLPPQAAA